MSLVAATSEGEDVPSTVNALLRRRKSADKLYWLINRPGIRFYTIAACRAIARRVVAAIAAAVAMTLWAFIGVVDSNIGYPRWTCTCGLSAPTATTELATALKKIKAITIWRATAHAAAELSGWLPAFIVLGALLVCIPYPRRWFFRLTMLSSVVIGYYLREAPAFPRSAIGDIISGKAGSVATRINLSHASGSIIVALLPLALVAIVAYRMSRFAYVWTARTTRLTPRPPPRHSYSSFTVVNPGRRLSAVPVAGALLSVSLWLAENIRAQLARTTSESLFLAHSPPSVAAWVVLCGAVALTICIPRPQGLQGLLILFMVAITAYAFTPRLDIVGVPPWPPGPPGGFWLVVILYFLVVGLGFDLVAFVLDWHTRKVATWGLDDE
jgi:hypothetical protein